MVRKTQWICLTLIIGLGLGCKDEEIASLGAIPDETGENSEVIGKSEFGPNGPVDHILALPNGDYILVGRFDKVAKVPVQGVAKFNANGLPDLEFIAQFEKFQGRVEGVKELDDGTIAIFGENLSVGDSESSSVLFFNDDGSLDSEKMTSIENSLPGHVKDIAQDLSGKIHVVGLIRPSYDDDATNYRLLAANGSHLPAFTEEASDYFDDPTTDDPTADDPTTDGEASREMRAPASDEPSAMTDAEKARKRTERRAKRKAKKKALRKARRAKKKARRRAERKKRKAEKRAAKEKRRAERQERKEAKRQAKEDNQKNRVPAKAGE